MKKTILAVSMLMLASLLWANNPTDALIDRIESKVQVNVAGQEAGAQRVASARSGSAVYEASCAACHNSGAAGAPRLGSSDWADRLDEKGLDALVQNTIDGLNAMPPRGGCSDCSDDEIAAAVDHILDESI